MGPTGMLPSSSDPALSQITFDELAQNYYDRQHDDDDGQGDRTSTGTLAWNLDSARSCETVAVIRT